MINAMGDDLMMNDTVSTADGIEGSIEEIRDDGVALLLSSRGHIEGLSVIMLHDTIIR